MDLLKRILGDFFAWYERHYVLNIGIAAGLFVLQLVHLYWLSTEVVAQRLTGESYFAPSDLLRFLILIVDYAEIPALLTASLIYLNELRRGWRWRSVLFLLLLNSQWFHIFWITDEFVVAELGGENGSGLPPWLAWVAILIDYLELPVIFDTLRRFVIAIRAERLGTFLREDLR